MTHDDRRAAVSQTLGFTLAGRVRHLGLGLLPAPLPTGRERHRYGNGPFAKLLMPDLPATPGIYLWELEGVIVYVGQTAMSLRTRLGSNGYSTISNYNTFARQAGRSNGGQQTNCRVNMLANSSLAKGDEINIWYQTGVGLDLRSEESKWMHQHSVPQWNKRDERSSFGVKR